MQPLGKSLFRFKPRPWQHYHHHLTIATIIIVIIIETFITITSIIFVIIVITITLCVIILVVFWPPLFLAIHLSSGICTLLIQTFIYQLWLFTENLTTRFLEKLTLNQKIWSILLWCDAKSTSSFVNKVNVFWEVASNPANPNSGCSSEPWS